MNEQLELWPKPIMYGTGFKITIHEKEYRSYRKQIDQFIKSMLEVKE